MENMNREELSQLLTTLLNTLNSKQQPPLPTPTKTSNSNPQNSLSSGPPKKKGVGVLPQNLSVRPGPPYLPPGQPVAPSGAGGNSFSSIVDSLLQQAAPPGGPSGISTADIVIGGGFPVKQKKKPTAASARPPKKTAAQGAVRPGGNYIR